VRRGGSEGVGVGVRVDCGGEEWARGRGSRFQNMPARVMCVVLLE
jgi:hypothetical protein